MLESKGNLTSRLKAIRKVEKKREKRPEQASRKTIELSAPWRKIGEYTFIRSVTHPNPVDGTLPNRLLEPFGISVERAVFFDLETTGLSGGAGNVAFLTGFGKVSGEKLTVTQYFLADYPGEREYLEHLLSFLDEDAVYISFNGKSFDSHFLMSKFLMNRMRFSFEHQIDLLHISRRLWKQCIGSCSLGSLEESILSVAREEDVPGHLVPELYFSFLKTGETDRLWRVFSHNEQDIISLALLLNRINTLFTDPRREKIIDRPALGKYLLEQNDPTGEKVLLDVFANGDANAGRLLSLYYKRTGRWEEALSLWERMWEENKSIFSGTEAAKYYEHRTRNYKKALEITERMLRRPFLTREVKDNLKRRKKRLRSKLISKQSDEKK